ncbi:MAG: helix-hairpin-helix domain-containing protein, partial [Eubacterium sp.]
MKQTDLVSTIKGIGPKRAEAFLKRGIKTIADLLYFFPRRYLDRTVIGSLAQAKEEPATLRVTVLKKGVLRRIRSNMSLFVLPVQELKEDGTVIKGEVVFFNQPYLRDVFCENDVYYLYGKVQIKNNKHQVYNPQFAHESKCEDFLIIAPVYQKIEGIPNDTLKKVIAGVLKEAVTFEEVLPQRYRTQYGLLSLGEAFKNIHLPQTLEAVEAGKFRFKFEEALKINMGILNNRSVNGASEIRLNNYDAIRRFVKNLPFELTRSQLSVCN